MFIRYFRTVCLEYKQQKTSDMLVCTGVCREKKKRQGTGEVILFSGNSKHLNKISQKLSLIFIIKLISNIMENHNISNLFLKTYFSTKIASTFKENRVQKFGWWSNKFSPLWRLESLLLLVLSRGYSANERCILSPSLKQKI